MEQKEKYKPEDFLGDEKNINFKARLLNELHNVYTALWKMKEKKE